MNLRSIENRIFSGKQLDNDEQEHLLGRVNDIWDNHPDVDSRFPRWRKYIAWIAGYQLYDYNKYSKKLIEIPLKRTRRLIFNRLRPFVRSLLAKLTADIPTISVVPKTTEQSDIEAARAGDRLVEHLSEKLGFLQTLSTTKLWTVVANRAFLRVFWNKEAHGVIDYLKENEEDEETGEVIGEKIVELTDEGDVGLECIGPFNGRVDPLYVDHEKWRWFVFGEEVDAEILEEEYGLEGGSLEEKSSTLERAYDLELYDEHEIIMGSSKSKKQDIVGKTIVLKELWTPRIYVFAAGDKILEYGVNKYGEIPFYPIEEQLIPISNYEKGFQYNESIIKDAIGIQREYNRQISTMSLALDRASKLKILVPFGSLMSKKQMTNDFGVFIDFNPKMGAEPHQMRLDPIPPFAQVFKTELEREFEMTFGVREASFGRLPERASHASGTLVSLLLEQDDVLLNPLLSVINHAMNKAWSLILRLVQDNYSIPRMIRYVGDDGQDSVLKFKGADLAGNTDVKIVSQSGLPRSRALRIEYIMKLREAGLLVDDKNTLEMLEFSQAEKIFKDNLLHERMAYKENAMIEDNPEINPQDVTQWTHPLEDKLAHLKIHMRGRFSSKFGQLQPNQQQAYEMLLQATQQAIQEEQMQQMQMASEAQMRAKDNIMRQLAEEATGGQPPGGGTQPAAEGQLSE